MNANTYQKLAERTLPQCTLTELEDHALHGMTSEIGEIHGIYQKKYQGHQIDQEHLKKEVGDLMWFVAEYCTAKRWDLGDILEMNIEKLKARYPDGFDADHSLHRAEGDV